MSLAALAELSRAYLLQTVRSKTALFWTLGFPQVWLFAFAFMFGGGTPEGVTALMPNVLAITIFAGSFFGVSYTMVGERENGILRRYHVTPVSALTVVLANGMRSVATVGTSVVFQALLAWLIFDVRFAGSALTVAVVVAGSLVAFVPLGLILGAVARDMRSAPALGNLIFFPMMFFSGAAVPFYYLPEWLRTVARALPASYVTDALQGAVVRGDSAAQLVGPLVAMVVAGAAAALVNAALFRWESTDPIEPRRAVVSLAGLVAVYVAIAVVGPPLEMSTSPPPGVEAAAGGTMGVSGGGEGGP